MPEQQMLIMESKDLPNPWLWSTGQGLEGAGLYIHVQPKAGAKTFTEASVELLC